MFARDLDARPVEGIDGHCSQEEILLVLARYGISSDKVELWGTGKPLREFLWSEEMAMRAYISWNMWILMILIRKEILISVIAILI